MTNAHRVDQASMQTGPVARRADVVGSTEGAAGKMQRCAIGGVQCECGERVCCVRMMPARHPKLVAARPRQITAAASRAPTTPTRSHVPTALELAGGGLYWHAPAV